MIPHSRPTLEEGAIRSVVEVLRSGHIAQGRRVEEFERKVAEYVGRRGGVATSSGTSALHLVLMALGVGEGDEVIIPSYVCTALLNAVNYVGARPILVDIDPYTYNMDPGCVTKTLTRRSKAIIVPHMFGLPADMDEILSTGLSIIEDCAQALGARYRGRRVGSMGVASICSFYATKVITTGEGGMVLSDSEAILQEIRDLRDYDKRSTFRVRFNYKMTDMQAALGLNQVDGLELFIKRRKEIATFYMNELAGLSIVLPSVPHERDHIFYRYVIQVEGRLEEIIEAFSREGVGVSRPVYLPLHRYLNMEGFPGAEMAWEKAISIPIYPSLTPEEARRVVTVIRRVLA